MVKNLNRRNFLKGTFAAAGAAAASSVPLPQAVKASMGGGRELATVLDLSKCIGCGECVEACRTVSQKYKPAEPANPIPKMFPPRVKVEDWSQKQDVTIV